MLLLNIIAKEYGIVAGGDYKKKKIGLKSESDDYFYIIPKIGKFIKITRNEIKVCIIHTIIEEDGFEKNTIAFVFSDNKKSICLFNHKAKIVLDRLLKNSKIVSHITEDEEEFKEYLVKYNF